MRTRLSDLTETLLQQRRDLDALHRPSDEPDDFLDFLGGPNYLDDECIYDKVDDATARWLLDDWLDHSTNVGWQVHLELSKLLAKRGNLVRERVEKIIQSLAVLAPDEGGFTPWGLNGLCLSFLPQMTNGEELAVRFLDRVPEDFRHGVLHACYSLNTPKIYEAVKASVRRWDQEIWCASSTGEGWLVSRMVKRWDRTFPDGDHADIKAILLLNELDRPKSA